MTTAIVAAVAAAATAGAQIAAGAAIITAIKAAVVVAALVFTVGSIISVFTAPEPDSPSFGGLGEFSKSPRYAFGPLQNTVSNELSIPLVYGTGRIAGNIIWQTDPGETIKQVIVLCEGEIDSISDIRINDQPYASLPGVSVSAYTGTATQAVDSRAPTSGANSIPSLRFVAYLASTLTASEKLQGSAITACTVKGLKVETWNGSAWDTAKVWSDNPVAALRDYLTSRRYGAGLDKSFLDEASFGAAYDQCEVLVSDGQAGTHKRFRIDFVIDARRPHLDIIRDILMTMDGYLVFSAGKIKLRILGLNDTTQHAFTEDNIVRDSLTYRLIPQDQRANQIVLKYVDPTQNWAKVDVVVTDAIDQAEREALLLENIVQEEFQALGITRQQQALRLATLMLNDARIHTVMASWKGGHDTIHLEVGDIVTLTHSTPGWTAKPFRIVQIQDEQIGERTFLAREHNSSLYDDRVDTSIQLFNYGAPSSPFDVPPNVSNVQIQAIGFLNKDGVFVSNLEVTWTEPLDREFVLGYSIEWSEDSGAFVERATASVGKSKVILPNAKVGSTYQAKVRTVSTMRVKSDGVTSPTITVDGKTAPPLDVTGFAVSFAFDHLHFTWNENPDVDIWGYEIREGASWELGVVIATKIPTNSYDLFSLSTGTKTYWIKAIDTSGNYSANAAQDSITITSIPANNVVFTHSEFKEGIPGTLGGEGQVKWTKSFNSAYYRRAIGLRSDPRWATKTGTWTQAQSAGDIFGQPITTVEGTYESQQIDLGAIFSVNVQLNLGVANVAGGVLTVEIDRSDDGVVWSGWKTFAAGVYSGRYFKFKLRFKTTNTAHDVEIYDFQAIFDVPDLIQSGSNVSVAAGGSTITYPRAFNADPSLISVVVTSVGSPYVPEIVSGSKTKTQFQVKLRDSEAPAYKAGTVDWYAKAY